MLRKYELQPINEPNSIVVTGGSGMGLVETMVKGSRAVVGIEVGLVGMLASIDLLGIPGIVETFATRGRRGKVTGFLNRIIDGIEQTVERVAQKSFYNAYADTNLLRGLAKGLLIGQADTAASAVAAAEAGGLIGAIIGSRFGETANWAVLGAKIGAGIYGAVAELGVIGGAFDRIRASFGAEGPLARMDMRRVQRDTVVKAQ